MPVTDSLTLVLQARDLASAEVNRLNKALAGTGLEAKSATSVFGKLGNATGGLITPTSLAATAVLGIGAALINVAQGAADEEVGILRLNTSLKQNAVGWDGNTAAIEDAINKAEDWSAFSRNDLRNSLALLVGATHDVTKAFDVQKVAMDLARYKGISLSDATDALTKVEGGSYRILKSLGIELKNNATQTDALAAVEKVAAGQAQQFADSHAGAWDKILNKAHDAANAVGDVVLTITDGIGKIGTPMDTTRNHFGNATKGIKSDSTAIGIAFDELKSKGQRDFEAMTAAAANLNGGLNDMRTNLVTDAQLWAALRNPDTSKTPNPGRTGAKPHAEGGWVGLHGPELAILGEKGPEFVVKNSDLGKSAPAGRSVHLHVHSVWPPTPQQVKAMADALDRHESYARLGVPGTAFPQ